MAQVRLKLAAPVPMPVVDNALELWHYRIPLTPPLAMKYGVLHEREGLFLAAPSGWAELAPFPGLSRESLCDVSDSLRRGAVTPSVSLAQAMLTPPAALPSTARVPLNVLLTDHLETPWADALVRQEEGYRSFKLKVGLRAWTEDVQRVLKLRAILGETAEIRLDANRTWSLDQALAFAEHIKLAQVSYIEEPLIHAADLPAFAMQTGIGVALDESLAQTDPDRFKGLVALVLKPSFLGWERTWHLGQWAVAHDLKVIVSSTFESGLALSFFARLAAFWSPKEAAGLDTWRAFATEICPWYEIHRGEMLTTPAMRTQPLLNPLYFQKWEV